MAGIRIGDDECSIAEIVDEFLKPPMDVVLIDKWTHLAHALHLPYSLIKVLQDGLTLGKISYPDIVNELLINWLSRTGNKATIGKLLGIIVKKFVWKGIEEFLRLKIQQNAKHWDDLDDQSKHQILSTQIEFLGKKTCLNIVKSQMKENDFNDALKQHVDREFLKKALEDQALELDQLQLPDKLPYYINRTLTWKRKLNPAMFQSKCPDIFVFEGMQRHHLFLLARPNRTDLSGGQLNNLNARFILLECEYDFEIILGQATVPVHRIKYEDGQYYWKFTAGSLHVIRSYLSDESEEITEHSIVETHLSAFCSRPLAVVSSPGMGKSIILKSIANRVQEQFSERIVIFLEMRSFIQQIQNIQKTPNLHDIKGYIVSHISKSRLGQTIILNLLKDEGKKIELFLDGFDEVPLEHFKYAKEFLTSLLESKNIRAHISSRPHLQAELEDTVGVISFDIIPFQPKDQINFLCGFWKNQLGIQNKERLTIFAEIAVKDLTSDFIGIPIQCYLLAEIYSREVERFISLDTECYQITNPSKSIFELYKTFVQMGLERVPENDRDWVRKYHWAEALKVLFIGDGVAFCIHELLEDEISARLCPLETVFAAGILQAERMITGPFFVHRTLAEFLVGDLITEYVKGHILSDCELMVSFIFETVLATCVDTQEMKVNVDFMEWVAEVVKSSYIWRNDSSNEHKFKLVQAFFPFMKGLVDDFDEPNQYLRTWPFINGVNATFNNLVHILRNLQWTEVVDALETYVAMNTEQSTFVNSTMIFFLNEYLAGCDYDVHENSPLKNHAKLYQQSENDITGASFCQVIILTKKCYKHLLALLIPILYDELESPLGIADSQKLLNWAAYGEVDLFQFICSNVEKFGGTTASKVGFIKEKMGKTEFECTPLHCALVSGNYKLAEYLINFYEDSLTQMHFLYEFTLINSWRNSPDVIENKLNILHLLKSIITTFDIKSLKQIAPLGTIAAELLICTCNMIGYAANNENEEFIAESFGFSIKNEFQMKLVVDWLASKDLTSFLMHKNANIVKIALFGNNFLPDMLRKICKLCSFDFRMVMWHFMGSNRAEEFVNVILEICGNVNITDSENCTMLHYAALFKKPNIIRHLLLVEADVNLKNCKGETALVLAKYTKNCFNFDEIKECTDLLTNATAKSKKPTRCIVM